MGNVAMELLLEEDSMESGELEEEPPSLALSREESAVWFGDAAGDSPESIDSSDMIARANKKQMSDSGRVLGCMNDQTKGRPEK